MAMQALPDAEFAAEMDKEAATAIQATQRHNADTTNNAEKDKSLRI